MSKCAEIDATHYYDAAYFEWQNKAGRDQGLANLFKFSQHIEPADRVLDFGCGSGALLQAVGLRDGSLIGVEINPSAQDHARSQGLEIVAELKDVPTSSVDVVISNHALEHVENPIGILREMRRVLRSGGRIVIVVPCDRASFAFSEKDPDRHLFSWSAGNLGNLARVAGFNVLVAQEIVHKWPPKWRTVLKFSGWKGFHFVSRIWARFDRSRSQVKLVAQKR